MARLYVVPLERINLKKVLTALIFCSIIFFGCGKNPVPVDSQVIQPLPNLKEENAVVKVLKQGEFTCPNSKTVVGKVVFFSRKFLDSSVTETYVLWVFVSNDSVLVQYDKDLMPGNTWIDFGNDLKPDFYFKNPATIHGFPDICKSLDFLRNLNDGK